MNPAPDSDLEANRISAATWGAGGRRYDTISFAISDALAHAAQRLNAKADQRILDVATGTGWTARNVARTGARVAAIDIAPELLLAAQELRSGLSIDFKLANAQELPFPDAHFDGIISTFGVMFAFDQRRAAGELARVCRSGGRLVLTTWPPDGAVARFFAILAGFSDAPMPPASPLAWGDPAYVTELLGSHFALKYETGVSHAFHDDEADIWNWYVAGFGPMRALVEALDMQGQAALRRDVDAYHRHYRCDVGLNVAREYLLTFGIRN
jgi:SAM-dependent methyltransferase